MDNLNADARSSHRSPSMRAPYVRPARLSDASDIAALQARQMIHTVERALGSTLSTQARAHFDEATFAAQWKEAIATSRQENTPYAVLVLRTSESLLGFAALAPAEQAADAPTAQSTAAAYSDFVITAFEIAQQAEALATPDGITPDGSEETTANSTSDMLLSAIVETARRYRAATLYLWLFASDGAVPALTRYGFEPTGVHQTFTVDAAAIAQHLWKLSL